MSEKITKKIKIMVLFGGKSSEHTISCATAATIISNIDTVKYDVLPVGVTKTGKWVKIDGDISRFNLSDRNVEVPDSDFQVTLTVGGVALVMQGDKVVENLGKIDLALPLIHGQNGEDGTIQGYFEICGVKYVGCGVFASAACMDKHYTKVVLSAAGLPIAPYALITDLMWKKDPELAMDQVASLGYPVFVKPSRAGSSVGVSRVNSPKDLREAIEKAREIDTKVLVEMLLHGKEVEVAVLESFDGLPRVSYVGEYIMNFEENGFYDYENKYFGHGRVSIQCPANLPYEVSETIKHQAAKAFQTLDCQGLARVDFFYDEEKSRITINEINTMPGFTPYSMYPVMWKHTGLEMKELIENLIQLGLRTELK